MTGHGDKGGKGGKGDHGGKDGKDWEDGEDSKSGHPFLLFPSIIFPVSKQTNNPKKQKRYGWKVSNK